MAKKTQKSTTLSEQKKTAASETTTPAVRRRRTTKTAAGSAAPAAARRRTSTRVKKAAAADDRGVTAISRLDAPEPTHDEIATRAYFVYLRRKGAPGNPDDDWMTALQELRQERGL
jgi:hypothetical protein